MTIRDEDEGLRRRAADPVESFRLALFLSTPVVGACVVLAFVAGSGRLWLRIIWGAALGSLATVSEDVLGF